MFEKKQYISSKDIDTHGKRLEYEDIDKFIL